MDPGRRDPAARAATAPRSGRPSPVVGVVLLALALLTARLGPAPLCTFAAVVAGLAALELATSLKRQGAAVKPIAAGAGAAALTVGAHLWGETALLTMAALLFAVYAGALAIRGLRPGTVRTLAALLLPAVYAGLAGAFLVLVRRGNQGTALVEVAAGLVVANRLGLWASRKLRAGEPLSRAGMAAGVLACVVASPLLGFLLDPHPGVIPMLGLGLFVGLAAAVGTLGSGLLGGAPQPGAKPAPRPILEQIEPALLAVPAFFYAFRLLLI